MDDNKKIDNSLRDREIWDACKRKILGVLVKGEVSSLIISEVKNVHFQLVPDWCPHISCNLDGKYIFSGTGHDVGSWKFCPLCAAVNPVPKPYYLF